MDGCTGQSTSKLPNRVKPHHHGIKTMTPPSSSGPGLNCAGRTCDEAGAGVVAAAAPNTLQGSLRKEVNNVNLAPNDSSEEISSLIGDSKLGAALYAKSTEACSSGSSASGCDVQSKHSNSASSSSRGVEGDNAELAISPAGAAEDTKGAFGGKKAPPTAAAGAAVVAAPEQQQLRQQTQKVQEQQENLGEKQRDKRKHDKREKVACTKSEGESTERLSRQAIRALEMTTKIHSAPAAAPPPPSSTKDAEFSDNDGMSNSSVDAGVVPRKKSRKRKQGESSGAKKQQRPSSEIVKPPKHTTKSDAVIAMLVSDKSKTAVTESGSSMNSGEELGSSEPQQRQQEQQGEATVPVVQQAQHVAAHHDKHHHHKSGRSDKKGSKKEKTKRSKRNVEPSTATPAMEDTAISADRRRSAPVTKIGQCRKSTQTTRDVVHAQPFKKAKVQAEEKDMLTFGGPHCLSTVEGQFYRFPDLNLEDAKVAAKKEYNRRNAARARHRTKSLIEKLQQETYTLSQETSTLKQDNASLMHKLQALQQQNNNLVQNQCWINQTYFNNTNNTNNNMGANYHNNAAATAGSNGTGPIVPRPPVPPVQQERSPSLENNDLLGQVVGLLQQLLSPPPPPPPPQQQQQQQQQPSPQQQQPQQYYHHVPRPVPPHADVPKPSMALQSAIEEILSAFKANDEQQQAPQYQAPPPPQQRAEGKPEAQPWPLSTGAGAAPPFQGGGSTATGTTAAAPDVDAFMALLQHMVGSSSSSGGARQSASM